MAGAAKSARLRKWLLIIDHARMTDEVISIIAQTNWRNQRKRFGPRRKNSLPILALQNIRLTRGKGV
jgi:hypothetical protein